MALEVASDMNIFDICNNENNERSEYPSQDAQVNIFLDFDNETMFIESMFFQLLDNWASFRFIEPEVIIKEFSIEKLKAFKNKRFVKDNALSPVCPVCDKSFQRNSHLKRHLMIHTKEKVCISVPFILNERFVIKFVRLQFRSHKM